MNRAGGERRELLLPPDRGRRQGEPAGSAYFTGWGRSPEVKDTVEQRFRTRLFSHVPRRGVMRVQQQFVGWPVV